VSARSGATATATLLEDAGAAASGGEFFRSSEFLAAEGVTHTLRIEADAGELLAPLVVRDIEGDGARDASSPYGYPGLDGPAQLRLDPSEVDWSATGLVSIFLRHRLDRDPAFEAATDRNIVQIADPALPRKSRPTDRRQIRRNAERGYRARRVDAPSASAADRSAFLAAYAQTMERTDAGERYRFGAEYFAALFEYGDSSLFLIDAPGGEVAAASIVARSDAMLHYYLSGTADRYLSDAPMKNLVEEIVGYCEHRELPLNLGGGLSPGDSLEEFKRGFANRSEPFRTSEVVCDPAQYERLCAGREAGGFFPAYRAPPISP
jgi:Acetyltransferase (GNAT) domain